MISTLALVGVFREETDGCKVLALTSFIRLRLSIEDEWFNVFRLVRIIVRTSHTVILIKLSQVSFPYRWVSFEDIL